MPNPSAGPTPSASTSSRQAAQSPALPLAHAALKILMVLNWGLCALILALLFVVPARIWILGSFHIPTPGDADELILGMRGIAVCGLLTIPLNYIILKRLLAMVDTVRARNPFVAANAQRLKQIAWSLLGLQMLGITIGAIAKEISTAEHPVHMDAGFSINGWLAVLLTFLLARVFAEGTAMRDELEGTV